jgi:hypothetical protein
MVLPVGTPLPVRLDQPLNTKDSPAGTTFSATVSTAVMRNGEVAVPQGAVCRGHVVQSKSSGNLKGRAVMGLALDSVEFNGRTYAIAATAPTLSSKNHNKHNLKWIGGGAAGGTALGALAGGGVGAAIGLGAGAAAGTAGAAITGEKQVSLAAETPLVFTLQKALEVGGPGRHR